MKWRAASSHISPAPISSTVLSSRVPKILRASSTAAKETETALLAISVSVRTRLATEKALCNRRLRISPAVLNSLA